MQRYFGQARDASGRVVAGVQAAVYVSGTSTLATIYNASDGDDTPASSISNPITTDSNGNFGFAAANGDYDVVISGSNFGTLVYPRINFFDGSSTTPTTAAGSTNQVQYNSGGALAASANLIFDPSIRRLTVGGTGTPATLSSCKVFAYDTANTFLESNIQNKSNGTSASSDHTATADNGTDTTNFVDMGINSSTWSDASWTINGALGSYLYCNGGDLAIGTATAAKNIYLFTGGTLAANKRVTVDGSTGLVTFANGINFGQQSLSNYSEGTWTPSFEGDGVPGTGQTYAALDGTYTRCGILVIARFRMALTSKGTATGNMSIVGLPFAASAANYHSGYFSSIDGVTLPAGTTQLSMRIPPSGTYASFIASGSGVTSSFLPVGNFSSTAQFIGVLVYHV